MEQIGCPGWFRLGVNYSGTLEITAFKDPVGTSFAIVVVNSSNKVVRQTFSLDGVSTDSVLPWITSPTLSLAPQAPVSVMRNNFTYPVPASSVTTFSGTVHTVR